MTTRSALQLPGDAGGLESRIQKEVRRITSVLAFLEQVETALRQELALLTREGAQVPVAAWSARLDLAARQRQDARLAFEALDRRQGAAQLAALKAFDAHEPARALQALRELVAAARSHAAGQAPLRTTGPLPPRVTQAATSALGRDRAAPGLADRSHLQGRRGFEATHRLATEVLAHVTPRLQLVQTALGTTGLPGPRRLWEEVARATPAAVQAAGIAPPMAPWVPKLARLFLDQAEVARKALVAVNHWVTARGMHRQAEEARERTARLPAEAAERALADFPSGRYYGAIFPLCNLHLHFAGVTHLGTLFPPRPTG